MTEQQQPGRNRHKHQRIVHSSEHDPNSPNLTQSCVGAVPTVTNGKAIQVERREDICSCYADPEKAEKGNDQRLVKEDAAYTEEEQEGIGGELDRSEPDLKFGNSVTKAHRWGYRIRYSCLSHSKYLEPQRVMSNALESTTAVMMKPPVVILINTIILDQGCRHTIMTARTGTRHRRRQEASLCTHWQQTIQNILEEGTSEHPRSTPAMPRLSEVTVQRTILYVPQELLTGGIARYQTAFQHRVTAMR